LCDQNRSWINKISTIVGTVACGAWGSFYIYDKAREAYLAVGFSELRSKLHAGFAVAPNALLTARSISRFLNTSKELVHDYNEYRNYGDVNLSFKASILKFIFSIVNLGLAFAAMTPGAKFMADSSEKYYSDIVGIFLVLGVAVFTELAKWDALPRLEQKIKIYPSGSFFTGKPRRDQIERQNNERPLLPVTTLHAPD